MLKLVKFIKENDNWEELLSAAPYSLKISRDNGYVMFKYNQIESDFKLDIVREARGLILREFDLKPVCVPFFKFGNYGECYCPEINWSKASVQEKIDGSLMKVWFDDDWHISTNGTIDAYKAPLNSIKHNSYGELFETAVHLSAMSMSFDDFTAMLDENYTYMFELVSPENRVVIPYEETKLYFLGARNNKTLKEVMPEYTELYHRFDIPKRFNLHSLDDVKNAASELPWDLEGYVVCDDNFNRVKIKSPAYVSAHYMRTNNVVSYERLLDIVLTGEKAEFLIYASDFKDELEKVETLYNKMIFDLNEEKKVINPSMFATRKDYALEVLKRPRWMQAFLFKYDDTEKMIKETTTEKWVSYMKEQGELDE